MTNFFTDQLHTMWDLNTRSSGERSLEVEVHSKVLGQSILNHLSSEWNNSFVCYDHSIVGRQKFNYIILNCYMKNLARDMTETRRRDHVKERMKIANK